MFTCSLPTIYAVVFIARCYAERGIAMASRPSVPLSVGVSVTLRYRDHTS